jgi:hypothetical protein
MQEKHRTYHHLVEVNYKKVSQSKACIKDNTSITKIHMKIKIIKSGSVYKVLVIKIVLKLKLPFQIKLQNRLFLLITLELQWEDNNKPSLWVLVLIRTSWFQHWQHKDIQKHKVVVWVLSLILHLVHLMKLYHTIIRVTNRSNWVHKIKIWTSIKKLKWNRRCYCSKRKWKINCDVCVVEIVINLNYY